MHLRLSRLIRAKKAYGIFRQTKKDSTEHHWVAWFAVQLNLNGGEEHMGLFDRSSWNVSQYEIGYDRTSNAGENIPKVRIPAHWRLVAVANRGTIGNSLWFQDSSNGNIYVRGGYWSEVGLPGAGGGWEFVLDYLVGELKVDAPQEG